MRDDQNTITPEAIKPIEQLGERKLTQAIIAYLGKEDHLSQYLARETEKSLERVLTTLGKDAVASRPDMPILIVQEIQEAFMKGLLIHREAFRLDSCLGLEPKKFSAEDLK